MEVVLELALEPSRNPLVLGAWSNTPAGVRAKVAECLAAGTRLVWVVDTEARAVTVYRSLLAPRTLIGSDVLEGEDVVPGFCLEVAEIFEI